MIRTCTITEFRRNSARLTAWLNEPGRVLRITRYGDVIAVALSPVTYEDLKSAA